MFRIALLAWMFVVPVHAHDMDPYAAARERMVRVQLASAEISDAVRDAMRVVPRHLFMPYESWPLAYGDHPVLIGYGQTISQPYMVALMSTLADIEPGDKVLEVGTGSGYQAAVLAELGAEVYTIEIIVPLAHDAAHTLVDTGYDTVVVRVGDGHRGWPEEAPFDAIVVTAAPAVVPQALLDQLAVGGHLIIPVGGRFQELLNIRRTPRNYRRTVVAPVRFVPMLGHE